MAGDLWTKRQAIFFPNLSYIFSLRGKIKQPQFLKCQLPSEKGGKRNTETTGLQWWTCPTRQEWKGLSIQPQTGFLGWSMWPPSTVSSSISLNRVFLAFGSAFRRALLVNHPPLPPLMWALGSWSFPEDAGFWHPAVWDVGPGNPAYFQAFVVWDRDWDFFRYVLTVPSTLQWAYSLFPLVIVRADNHSLISLCPDAVFRSQYSSVLLTGLCHSVHPLSC